MKRLFVKEEKAFTGLEAAIVLIAFVTVAAVFSYVMLGAGFFTTQKSQEVVHTGVDQATSSMEVVGAIIGEGNSDNSNLGNVTFTLQLAAGGKPINLNKTVIHVISPTNGEMLLTYSESGATNSEYNVSWVKSIDSGSADKYLEEREKAEITLNVTDLGLEPQDEFMFSVKPAKGASMPTELDVPAAIDDVMVLLH